MTLQEKIAYIGQDKFVKFTNTDDFPQLSKKLRTFLKEVGIYSNRKGYPYLISDGKLIEFDKNLIQFGKSHIMENPFCIDISKNEQIVGYDLKDKSIDIINSSIENYIECLYITYYFSREYEGNEKYGPYYKNHKKYAKELLKMYKKIEPNAMELPTWGGLIEEMESGVL
ncbi:MAG: hypothetical protein R2798_12200 [Chitinophagales bacterium]|nr:hypothetical protein [Bacteroidota bacterium]MCB9043011.1 hypothetical protein [Chitinophagales bacterium]